MFVQAVLLHRKGIGGFDPVSDGFLIFNGEPSEAVYYTWRKYNQPIPKSCKIAGVFLGDDYGNFTFEGTRNSRGLGYIRSVLPKLEEGYKHSEFPRLFEAPRSMAELVHKIVCINLLYFDAADLESPERTDSSEYSWVLDRAKGMGVTRLNCPSHSDHQELSEFFYNIVKEVDPSRYHDDPRIKVAA